MQRTLDDGRPGMSAEREQARQLLELKRLEAEVHFKEAACELMRRRLAAPAAKPERSFGASLRAALVGAIPLIAALAAPTAGLIQFGLSQEHGARATAAARIAEAGARAEASRTEARKAFNAKRLQLYEKAITVTGRLASERMDSPGFDKARRDFERLYWAELPLVESPEVSQAMARLRPALYRDDPDDLNQCVIEVANQIRADLRDVYGRSSGGVLVNSRSGADASD